MGCKNTKISDVLERLLRLEPFVIAYKNIHCTGKIFQKSKCPIRIKRERKIAFFVHCVNICIKIAAFQSKNVTFIILIINELKVFCS
jgi:hypothetical protein